ncbi:MAG: prenyltransferase [Syntrophales bacterium]
MAERDTDIRTKIAGWIGFSRPPFPTVGILPFLLGTVLAWRLDSIFNVSTFTLSVLGVALVMLSTYHAGEYLSDGEDERSKRLFRHRFVGGAGVIPDRMRPRPAALWTGIIGIALAVIIGLILQFGLRTGPLTLLLGCIGALPGVFYSTRLIRVAEEGWGEIFIAFCYSWLPIASAFYLQRGYIAPCIHWMALPIGLSIFNVILLNEFPDRPAGTAVGGTNLLIRLGKAKGMALYVLVSILSWSCMYSSLGSGIPRKAFYLYLPVMGLSAWISLMMARRKYENPLFLELLCGLNIAVNLGTTVAYMLAFF